MTELTYLTFAGHLRAKVPGFDKVYDEHVVDNYGEVLPHLLLGDLVRFLSSEVRMHGEKSAALQPAMLLLEGGLGSRDELLQNLIDASFIENLETDDPGFPAIKRRFGPRLEASFESWRRYMEGEESMEGEQWISWKRIGIYTLLLVLTPQLIGFLFGIWAPLVEAIVNPANWPDGPYWARVATILFVATLIYARLACVQEVARWLHVLIVVGAVEAVFAAAELVVQGSFGSPSLFIGLFIGHLLAAGLGVCVGALCRRSRPTDRSGIG